MTNLRERLADGVAGHSPVLTNALMLEALAEIDRLQAEVVGKGWQPIETAPKDGTPLLLFARCKTATASTPVIGWFDHELGWIEACYAPNQPVGLVPSHWMHRPEFPSLNQRPKG